MLGNGFVIDLYFTGMSRLFRAPETAKKIEKKVNYMTAQAYVRKKGRCLIEQKYNLPGQRLRANFV